MRGSRGSRADGRRQIIREALDQLNATHDNGFWNLLEGVACDWTRTGEHEQAAVLLGHLEHHQIKHAANVASRSHALGTIRSLTDSADWMQGGAVMQRVEIIEYALGQLGTDTSPATPRGLIQDPPS